MGWSDKVTDASGTDEDRESCGQGTVPQPPSPFVSVRQALPGHAAAPRRRATPPAGPVDRPKSNDVGNHFRSRTMLRFRSPNPDDLAGEKSIRAPFDFGQPHG
jgi:hypothetical protein